MTVSTIKMTAKQFLQLGEDPPGVRLELVDGEIAVSPSPIPEHSHIVFALATILKNHIDEHQLGELLGDVDTIFGEHDVRRPDVLYFAEDRRHLILGDDHRYVECGRPQGESIVRLAPFVDLDIPLAKLWRRP